MADVTAKRPAWGALLLCILLGAPACEAGKGEELPPPPPSGLIPVVIAARPIASFAFGCQEDDDRSAKVSVRLRADGSPIDVWLTADSELKGDALEACYRSNLMKWRWTPAENAVGQRVPYVWTETFTIVS